jgi:hypothetical protein
LGREMPRWGPRFACKFLKLYLRHIEPVNGNDIADASG